MKRFGLIGFILLTAFVLMACSSQNTVPDSKAPEEVTQSKPEAVTAEESAPSYELKVTVSAPEGWEFSETAGIPINYSKQAASFMIKEEPYSGENLDEVVEEAKSILEGAFDNFQLVGGVEDLTVDGRDAKKFVFTCEVFSIKMKFQYVFFFVDRDVYVITCGSSEDTYDNYVEDFEAFIDSVRVE